MAGYLLYSYKFNSLSCSIFILLRVRTLNMRSTLKKCLCVQHNPVNYRHNLYSRSLELALPASLKPDTLQTHYLAHSVLLKLLVLSCYSHSSKSVVPDESGMETSVRPYASSALRAENKVWGHHPTVISSSGLGGWVNSRLPTEFHQPYWEKLLPNSHLPDSVFQITNQEPRSNKNRLIFMFPPFS